MTGTGLSPAAVCHCTHPAGADVEAQEFQTVADRVNFDIKKRMYARFSMGVAAYLVARVCECPLRGGGGEGDS
jgi:hypothetical protein